MDFTVDRVRVRNWSKQPLLNLGQGSRAKLRTAIRYSREIVDDAAYMFERFKIGLLHQDMVDRGDFDAVDEVLVKWFGVAPGASQQARWLAAITISGKFHQIRAELNDRFEIVVGYIHDEDDVKEGLKDAFSELWQGGSFQDSWHHIKSIRTLTEGWVHGGHVRQRIHLNKDSIKNLPEGKIARIIVHEA